MKIWVPLFRLAVKCSIKARLVGLVGLLIAGIALFISLYFPSRLEEQIIAGVTDKAQSMAQMTAFSASAAVFFRDEAELAEAVAGARQNPDLAYVVIRSEAGAVLYSLNRTEAEETGFDRIPESGTSVEGGRICRTSAPILMNDVRIGTLYLGLSLDAVQATVTRSRTAVSLVGLAILIAGLIAVVGIGTVVVRPLGEVVAAAKRIELGDLTQRAEVTSQDEVGRLAGAFNHMVEHIESRTEDLQTEIRERKVAEEARTVAEQELESQRALSMRSDRLRSLGEMAAGIAHELSQPLVGVRGLAEHVLIGMERGWSLTDEKLRDRLGRIVEQADRMVHIIDHVRMFAREAGKPTLSTVDVNDVVRSGVDLLHEQFRSRGLSLACELCDHLPPVNANPFSLEEVVLNLLGNARDAVEDSGKERRGDDDVGVVVRTEVAPNGESPAVRIEVEDNGVGIPAEILAQVFDPFFTTKEPDKGTGLGLSISKSIVEDFGGVMQIESTVGKGTKTIISLPALDRRAGQEEG